MKTVHLASRLIEDYIANGLTVPAGEYHLDRTVVIDEAERLLRGSGFATRLVAPSHFPAIRIGNHRGTLLQDFSIRGGLDGIHIDGGQHVRGQNVKVEYARRHGVFVENGAWCLYWWGCHFKACKGSGYESVGTPEFSNGNNTSFSACQFWKNGTGLRYSANTLDLSGCLFEENAADGLLLSALERSCTGVDIGGTHFERNGQHQIFMVGERGYAVSGVSIAGNLFSGRNRLPLIRSQGPNGTVRFVDLSIANELFNADAEWLVDLSEAAKYCTIHAPSPASRVRVRDDANRVDYMIKPDTLP